jgi:hypothetical protein
MRVLLLALFLLTTPAQAGVFHKPQAEVVDARGPVVEVRPTRDPVKKESLGKQILRGGVFSFGVSMVAGALRLGLLAFGIPVL